MDVETLGLNLRLFFRNLFGSRVSATLEDQLRAVRDDCSARLSERDQVIAELRSQIAHLTAKLDTYETVLLPLTSPAGRLFSPVPPRRTFEASSEPQPMTWPEIQADHARRQAEETAAEAKETH